MATRIIRLLTMAIISMASVTSNGGTFVLQSNYLRFQQVWNIPLIDLYQSWTTNFNQTWNGPFGGQISLTFRSDAWMESPTSAFLRTTDLVLTTSEPNSPVDFEFYFIDVQYNTEEASYAGFGSIEGYADLSGYTGSVQWTKGSVHCNAPLNLPISGSGYNNGPPFGYAPIFGTMGAHIGWWPNNYEINTTWTLTAVGNQLYGPTTVNLPGSVLDSGIGVPECSPCIMLTVAVLALLVHGCFLMWRNECP